uniref:AFG2 AAA ATPase homolog B n=1 Tax=Leptobrachium leishanense TaxID=445787 RepID=A0A8C5PAL9_9ANUR
METDLKLLPPSTEDQGTQRCRLGPKAMSLLGVKIGYPVVISLPGGSYLCTAWPRRDLCDGYLQLDAMCSTTQLPNSNSKNSSVSVTRLKHLMSVKLRKVTVKVVLRDLEVKQRTSSWTVHELVKDVLRNLYVLPQYTVTVTGDSPVVNLVVLGMDPLENGAGLVTAKTTVHIEETTTLEWQRHTLQDAERCVVAGIDDICASLREMINLPLHYPETMSKLGLSCPKGLLLVGPPGVGKTLLVRAVAREAGAHLVSISGPAIHGSRPGEGEENLRNIFEKAGGISRSGPCLLFIDEIDSLCPKRGASENAPENRIVAQLLTLMDGIHSDHQMAIVAATNRPDALDPALRRPGRFDREVVIGVPTLAQRKAILEVLTSNMPVCDDVSAAEMADMTVGYVGADLTAMCREAAMQAVLQAHQDGADGRISKAHFYEAFRKIRPSSARSGVGQVEFKPVQWEQIGGLDDVKMHLKQSIEWPLKYPDAFIRMGLTLPKGVLLYGPPGCAKTTLVKAVATGCHCSFLSVSGADLFSPFVGDSEKTLAQIFRQARASTPAIVFLDEIDAIIGSRSDHGSGVQERILSVLLNELDGVGLKTIERRACDKVLLEGGHGVDQDDKLEFQEVVNKSVMIVAATNRPDVLDNALMRPGRLDKLLYVPPPDEKAALLSLHTSGLQATSVKMEHFQKSLQSMKPSLTVQDLEVYEKLCGKSRKG